MSKQRSNTAYLVSSDNCLDMLNTKNKKQAKPINHEQDPKLQVKFEIKREKKSKEKKNSKFKVESIETVPLPYAIFVQRCFV